MIEVKNAIDDAIDKKQRKIMKFNKKKQEPLES